MNRNIIAAIIVAVGLVRAAFLLTGRYYVLRVSADTVVRLDRWTGETKVVEAKVKPWWDDYETANPATNSN